jgi:DNA-binding transcriptional LysR family regulator
MDIEGRILRRLKLSDLRLLLAVTQWGGMAKAAARLNVSQPAVSKAISAMEHTLDVRLFDRSPRGLELTMYGHALLKCATTVFDDLNQGVRQIAHLANPSAGELRIGSTEPLVAGILGVILDRLLVKHPRITFRVILADFNTLHHELFERNVDLVIGRVHSSNENATQTEVLFYDQLFVTAATNNPWSRRRKVELRHLLNEPWTLPPLDTPIGALVSEAFHASGLEVPHANVTCFSVQMHNSMLATGRFFSMLSGSMIRFSADRLAIRALPIKLPIQPRPVGIITLKKRTVSPVAQLFFDGARDVAKLMRVKSDRGRHDRVSRSEKVR